ncbi:MFS transporter [Mycolicibacterium cosmeticum]|uniref:MFS transporter n=1 Tax=Mycolicibacterium cosmeticum TaxID=258533 RepID=UPI003204E45D
MSAAHPVRVCWHSSRCGTGSCTRSLILSTNPGLQDRRDGASNAVVGTPQSVWSRRFLTYWSATSLSNLGSGVTLVALPILAAQQLHAGAIELGYLRALETVPYLLFALVIGQLADRVQPLFLMITADIVRATLLVATVALAVSGHLTLALLYVAVFAIGMFTVTYDIAQFTFLPVIVPKSAMSAANSSVELARGAASTFGPALGGFLTAALRAGPSLLVDACSYIYSAVALLTLRHHRVQRTSATANERASLRSQLTGGLRFVGSHPQLRALTAYLGVNNVCNQAFLTGLITYLTIGEHRASGQVGIAFGAYGAGFLVAAAAATSLGRRFGVGVNVIGSSLLSAAGIGFLALSSMQFLGSGTATTLIFAGAFLVGFAAPLFNVPSVTLRLSLTPGHLLGRVNAVVKLVSQGSLPLGAVVAGALFSSLSPLLAFGVIAAASFAATAILAMSPLASTPADQIHGTKARQP